MKKLMVVLVLGAMLVGPMASQAQAGDREWAVAGKVLAGLFVLDAITQPYHTTTVVYQEPVYYPPVVTYPQPVVVHRPIVVYRPPVVVRRPVVYRRPVVCPPRVHYVIGRPSHRPHAPARPVYRTSYRRDSWHRR